MTRSVFLVLTKYDLLHILKVWINLYELCHFDTALCCVNRKTFLAYISEHQIVFSGCLHIPIGSSFFKWLQLRQLNISGIWIHSLANRKYDGALGCEDKVKQFKIENCAEYDLIVIRYILQLCVNLEELCIHCTYLTDDMLIPLITNSSSRLKQINIANIFACSHSITYRSIDHILTHCYELTSMTVAEHSDITYIDQQQSTIATQLPDTGIISTQLTYLNLKKCLNLQHSTFTHLIKKCPLLSTLIISDCPFLKNDSLQSISMYCPLLTCIDISFISPYVSVTGLQYLCTGCAYLTDIQLSDTMSMHIDQYLHVLVHTYGSQLKRLSVSSVVEHTKYVKDVNELQTFRAPTTDVGMTSDTTLPTANISTIVGLECISQCALLHSLHVDSHKLTDSVALAIATHCTQLTSIRLTSKAITNDGLIALISACNLSVSHIELYCSMLNDTTLLAIGTHCTGLIQLCIRSSNLITDKGVISVATSCGRSLQILRLNTCRMISDECIQNVSLLCTNLRELSILGCNVTGLSIQYIRENCDRLEKLSFYVSSYQKALNAEIVALKRRRKFLDVMIC